jgi:hypothetical protein
MSFRVEKGHAGDLYVFRWFSSVHIEDTSTWPDVGCKDISPWPECLPKADFAQMSLSNLMISPHRRIGDGWHASCVRMPEHRVAM